MPDVWFFIHGLFEEHFAYGHLPYILLIASILMRNIGWLRAIAIAAGLVRIYIRLELVYDPVTVFWEAVLVLINLVQLGLLWWESRHQRLNDDEALLTTVVLPNAPRRLTRRLLRIASWGEVPAETAIAREGEPVPTLMFVVDGLARIERSGAIVAVCGRGDFVGEMSFVAGGGATATVIAEKPMRMAHFDRERLRQLLAQNDELRHAMEASFNRNLIDKLLKTPVAA